jgi:NAD(P)-dependent dehydrogenase (short-subunit alcohol dehydrogenase family)
LAERTASGVTLEAAERADDLNGAVMAERLPVALVSGVGPGTGAAISRRFARGGFAVAMLARNKERLDALERVIDNARGYVCDVTDEAQVEATLQQVTADLGAPEVLVHNAVGDGARSRAERSARRAAGAFVLVLPCRGPAFRRELVVRSSTRRRRSSRLYLLPRISRKAYSPS